MSADLPLIFDKGPRITRLTIARLHNRGNYEHSRYEVTVDIPPGVDPGSVFREVEGTLAALKPNSPVNYYELQRSIKAMQDPKTDPCFESNRGLHETRIREYDEWSKRRDAALQRFSAMNGAHVFTDAKERWEDEY